MSEIWLQMLATWCINLPTTTVNPMSKTRPIHNPCTTVDRVRKNPRIVLRLLTMKRVLLHMDSEYPSMGVWGFTYCFFEGKRQADDSGSDYAVSHVNKTLEYRTSICW